MNTEDYRRYVLHPELRNGFTLDKAPEDSPDELAMLATVVCTKCPEMWDVHIPLQKGAFVVLQAHWSNKHAPITEWSGAIRKKSFRSRMERKIDNVLCCVSYLPGIELELGPGGRGRRRGRELTAEPGSEGCEDGTCHSGEEPVPIDVRHGSGGGRS